MATQFFYFKGSCKWAKVYEGQEDKKYGHFGLDFFPDDPKAFFATGVQLKERKDPETDKVFVQLRRKPSQLIKGELVKFGTPKVIDKNDQPFGNLIGNGSKVTVKIAVYDTVKGKGHRLEAVKVDEWVEFKKDGPEAGGDVPNIPF